MRQIAFALAAVAVFVLATSTAHAERYGHASSRTVVAVRYPGGYGHHYGGYSGHYGVPGHGYYLGVRPGYYDYAPYPRYYGGYGCYGYPSYGYPYSGYYYRPYGGFSYYGPRVGFSIGF